MPNVPDSILSGAAAYGVERAADNARCLADGGINALMRLEGVYLCALWAGVGILVGYWWR